MNLLCLDYGDQHIGIALATSPLAEPLTTLNIKNIFLKLPEILTKYDIQKIIIGNCPKEILAKLSALGREIIQVDETLTTIDAQSSLFHTTPSRRKAQIHAVSATLILQNYIDSNSFPS